MAKRFTDTEKFNDKWYRGLSPLQKVLWEYLLSECNHAGILEKFDTELITFKIGVQITLDDVKSLGKRVIFVSDEILYIPNFIKFQYEVLNPQNKVHASVLKILNKYNLKAPCEVLASPLKGAKDKDKDKDKTKKEKEGVQGEGKEEKQQENSDGDVLPAKEPPLPDAVTLQRCPDLFFDPDIQTVFRIYRTSCPSLIPIGYEKRNLDFLTKIKNFLNETARDFTYFEDVCKKADCLKFIVGRKIDLKSIVANHSRIFSGFYEEEEKEEKETMAEYLKKRKERQNE